MFSKVIAAEKFIWEKLFCPETNLIYEVVCTPESTSNIPGYKYGELPTPEEIANVFPNPCGWGTNMEDSVLNGCIFLDSVIDRYIAEGGEKCHAEAAKIWQGLKLCATISNSHGFLARSVSPYDCKSHYIDSSVDQYTHFIFSAVKYYDSSLADKNIRNDIRNILVSFAQRAEKNVTGENKWNLLREDGYPAVITYFASSDMLYTGIYRLPMFYAAAWHVTGDEHWKELYDKTKIKDNIPPFITFNDVFTGTLTDRISAYTILQSQLSIRLCYDIETDEEYKKVLYAGLKSQADLAVNYIPHLVSDVAAMEYNYYKIPHIPWRRQYMRYHFWFPTYNNHPFVIPEWPDDKPAYRKAYLKGIMLPRECGEALSIQQLCPGFTIAPEQFDGTLKVVESLDFASYEHSSAVQFVGGCRAYQRYLKESR